MLSAAPADRTIPPKKKFNPTQSTLKKIEIILQSLENGATIKAACEAAELSRDTFYDWKNASPENEARVHAILDNSRVLEAEDCLMEQVRKGNPTCLIFFLCNRAPLRWKRMDGMNITNANVIDKLPVIVQIEKEEKPS